MILRRKTYYQLVVIVEHLMSCVLPLFVIAFTYILTLRHLVECSCSVSQKAQNHRLITLNDAAKIFLGFTLVFLISHVRYHAFQTHIILIAKQKPSEVKIIKITPATN